MDHPLDLHPLREVASEAWNKVKKDSQPDFDNLPVEFKSELLERATRVEGGEQRLMFACAVAERLAQTAAEPEPVVEAEPVEAPAEPEDTEPEAEPTTQAEKDHLELKGPLPSDFPSHAKLHDAGINTYGQLNKVDDLTTIDGIGPATAKAIKKRLKADAKTLNK